MQIMEGDLARTIEANLGRIAHIQIADNPGRHEPGTGEINFPFLYDHIDRIGYSGWVGAEYKPKAGTEEGLGWFRELAGKGSAAAWQSLRSRRSAQSPRSGADRSDLPLDGEMPAGGGGAQATLGI